MTLEDLVGKQDALEVTRHLTLKSAMGELDALETREAKRFWGRDPGDPAIQPSGRKELSMRSILEDPKNYSLRAIRFAPFESPLPGAMQDWNVAFPGAELSKGIQVRFVFQAAEDEDAGVHVIYVLEPGTLRGRFDEINASTRSKIGVTGTNLAREAAALGAIYGGREYGHWWATTVNSWLDIVSPTKDDAERTARFNTLPKGLLQLARTRGFATDLRSLLQEILGHPVGVDKAFDVDLGRPALRETKSSAVQKMQSRVLDLVRAEGRIEAVTTFSVTGFEVWTFGKLKPSPAHKGALRPVSLETTDSFVQTAGGKPALRLALTSQLGIYENATELNEGSRSSVDPQDPMEFAKHILGPRVPNWSAFVKRNGFSMRSGFTRSVDPTQTPIAQDERANLIALTSRVRESNSSNMTCATCHISLEPVGPGARLHMLTGFGQQMNLRTAAELEHEVARFQSVSAEQGGCL